MTPDPTVPTATADTAPTARRSPSLVRRISRWIGFGVLIALITITVLVLTPPLRHAVTAWTLERILHSIGLDPGPISITEFGLARLTIEAPTVFGEAATARRVTVTYDPGSLLRTKSLSTVNLEGLSTSVQWDGTRMSAPLLDHLTAIGLLESEPSTDATPTAVTLPFDRLTLSDTRVDLDSPIGLMPLTLDLTLDQDPEDGSLLIEGDGYSTGPAALVVSAEAQLNADGTPYAASLLLGGTLGPMDLPLWADALSMQTVATVTLDPSGQLSVVTDQFSANIEGLGPGVAQLLPDPLRDTLFSQIKDHPLSLAIRGHEDTDQPVTLTTDLGFATMTLSTMDMRLSTGLGGLEARLSALSLAPDQPWRGTAQIDADLALAALPGMARDLTITGPLQLALDGPDRVSARLGPDLRLSGRPDAALLPNDLESNLRTLVTVLDQQADGPLALTFGDGTAGAPLVVDYQTETARIHLSGTAVMALAPAGDIGTLILDDAVLTPSATAPALQADGLTLQLPLLVPAPGFILRDTLLTARPFALTADQLSATLAARGALKADPDLSGVEIVRSRWGGRADVSLPLSATNDETVGHVLLQAFGLTADHIRAPNAQATGVGLSAAAEVTLPPLSTTAPWRIALDPARTRLALDSIGPRPDPTSDDTVTPLPWAGPLDLRIAPAEPQANTDAIWLRIDPQSGSVHLPAPGITLSHPEGDPPLTTAFGEGSGLELQASGHWPASAAQPLTVSARADRWQHPDLTVLDTFVNAVFTGTDPEVRLEARIQRLPGEPNRLPVQTAATRPLSLQATLTPVPETDTATLSTQVTSADGQLTLRGRGTLGPGYDTVELRMESEPIVFEAAGLQPISLHALAPGATELGFVSGTSAIKGRLRWTAGAAAPVTSAEILLDDVSLAPSGIAVSDINGVVRLTNLSPLRGPTQELAIAEIDAGLPLTGILLSYGFDASGTPVIDSATLGLAGGQVRMNDVRIPLDGAPMEMALRVEGLKLEELARLTELDGLTANGTLSGDIPLRINGRDLILDNAVLRTDAPGTLRYVPPTDPETLAAGNEGVMLFLLAVDNFHYELLEVSLNGSSNDELLVGLSIDGANPDLYNGYPIALNLNLSGAVMELIQKNIRTYTLPDRIREQIEGFR